MFQLFEPNIQNAATVYDDVIHLKIQTNCLVYQFIKFIILRKENKFNNCF